MNCFILVRFLAIPQKRTNRKQELSLNGADGVFNRDAIESLLGIGYNRAMSLGSSRLPIC